MDLELKDKVVFIAGASRGIGFAMARAFIKEGAKVALTARGEETLKEACETLRKEGAKDTHIFSMTGDMTKSKVIAATLDAAEKALGPVHCAIANVGLAYAPAGYDVSDEDWEQDMAQNLFSAAYLAREAARRMLARPAETRGDVNIILISSIASVNAYQSQITYSAAKAGMNHMARDMAKHISRQGVRLNVIAPGNIMFDGGVWDKNLKANPDVIGKWIKRDVPMKRFGTPEEIADAALFLASPRASFITGETLLVDGGQTR